MQEKYLGDSYDFVKRFFAEHLCSVAPLYGHPRFIPTAIHSHYTNLTSIKILDEHNRPDGKFGILLDPDTGIPLPTSSAKGASHASLPFIEKVQEDWCPAYIVCFDQSHHRLPNMKLPEQMEHKRDYLLERGIHSFYYNSHARFVFMAKEPENLMAIRKLLTAAGIPGNFFVP